MCLGFGSSPTILNVSDFECFDRKPAHLAIIRAYNIDASQLDFERVAAFPDWRDYKADFEFTPIHIAVLEDYDFDDEERPSLSELLEFVNLANNAAIGQNWVS